MTTRRKFLVDAPLGVAATLAACRGATPTVETAPNPAPSTPPSGTPSTPGAPGAFNTAPPVGPDVTPTTFAEAEKLVQVTMTPAQRQMAAANWRTSMAALMERRTGPRTLELEPSLAPASVWTP
ncbi:MAG TPA: hypothetical protein VFP90_01900, partial [Gemmatimonadaceae bacterium]|nr:hypothetical protein [Gemmatimonadaceae bacterium]